MSDFLKDVIKETGNEYASNFKKKENDKEYKVEVDNE